MVKYLFEIWKLNKKVFIIIYSLKNGELLQILDDHKDKISCLEIIGNLLISGSYDKTVLIWSLEVIIYNLVFVLRNLSVKQFLN